MFTAGPRIIPTSYAWHSSPSASPIFSRRSLSKEQAVRQPEGKQMETWLSDSPSSTFLRPIGPSVIMIESIPSLSTGKVCQLP